MRYVLAFLLAFCTSNVFAQTTTFILGDSIAKADTCSTVGPSDYLAPAINDAIDGNTIAPVTSLVRRLAPGRAWVHVGINDVMRDNRQAEKDLAQMLTVMSRQKSVFFVVDTLGPMAPASYSAAREAVRLRMNAQILAFNAPNVLGIAYNVTDTCDGIHPTDAGYAQHMPIVLSTFALSTP